MAWHCMSTWMTFRQNCMPVEGWRKFQISAHAGPTIPPVPSKLMGPNQIGSPKRVDDSRSSVPCYFPWINNKQAPLFFHVYMDIRDQTQATRFAQLSNNCLYPLNHLANLLLEASAVIKNTVPPSVCHSMWDRGGGFYPSLFWFADRVLVYYSSGCLWAHKYLPASASQE